jgi:hypothetical protein
MRRVVTRLRRVPSRLFFRHFHFDALIRPIVAWDSPVPKTDFAETRGIRQIEPPTRPGTIH